MKAIWRPLDVLIDRVADARWLSRERVVAYGSILLIAEIALMIYLALESHGVFGPVAPSSTDFLSFYASGRLANQGQAPWIYDISRLQQMRKAIYGDPQFNDMLLFLYPPVFVLLCSVLACLPYLVSFYVWTAGTLTLYCVSLRMILGEMMLTLAMLSFPATMINIGVGQNAALTAGLFAAASLYLDRRPLLAGSLFGALVYKPHFLMIVPLLLLAGRQFRALAATLASAGCLVLLSWAVFDTNAWLGFFKMASFAADLHADGTFGFWSAATPLSAIRLLGGGKQLATIFHAAAALTAIGFALWIWIHGAPLAIRAASLSSATLVAAPVLMSYDLMLGTVAIAWIVVDSRRISWLPWEKLILLFLWGAMLVGRGIAQNFFVPVMPLIAPCLLWLSVRRFLQSAEAGRV